MLLLALRILYLHITLILIQSLAAIAASHELPAAEISALLDLYHSTNGPRWRKRQWPKILEGYQTSTDIAAAKALTPCKWPGVKCKHGHVVQLSLEHCLNGGTLPASLSALEHVQVLDLGSNMLEGELPAEWGRGLKRVQQIEMDGNHFNSTIPKEWAAFLERSRGPARPGAAAGGARVFLGFNKGMDAQTGMYGFECDYPTFLLKKTRVVREGKKKPAKDSNVATSWGLPPKCGLSKKDLTPDEETPVDERAEL